MKKKELRPEMAYFQVIGVLTNWELKATTIGSELLDLDRNLTQRTCKKCRKPLENEDGGIFSCEPSPIRFATIYPAESSSARCVPKVATGEFLSQPHGSNLIV